MLRQCGIFYLKGRKVHQMRSVLLCIMAALSIAAVAAPAGAAAPAAPAFTSSFQKPPSASLKALRATVGKPFKEGYVFIDGRYLPPPYKVERWGTVLRINGVQVTSEIVPWDEFVKTQTGVTATKSESPLSDDIGAAEPEPEPEPEPEEEIDDDDSSLDDLFDDDPAPKKKKPAKRPCSTRPGRLLRSTATP